RGRMPAAELVDGGHDLRLVAGRRLPIVRDAARRVDAGECAPPPYAGCACSSSLPERGLEEPGCASRCRSSLPAASVTGAPVLVSVDPCRARAQPVTSRPRPRAEARGRVPFAFGRILPESARRRRRYFPPAPPSRLWRAVDTASAGTARA